MEPDETDFSGIVVFLTFQGNHGTMKNKIERVDGVMKIIVVSERTDEQVYREAAKRRNKHGL